MQAQKRTAEVTAVPARREQDSRPALVTPEKAWAPGGCRINAV